MASTWGDAWNGAWGVSWDIGVAAPVSETSWRGGYDLWLKHPRRRKKHELEKAREAFGIPAVAEQIVRQVAARQVEHLGLDQQQQIEELKGEFALSSLQLESRYIALLEAERNRLMDEEIGRRLRALQRQEEEFVLILAMI